MKVEKHTAAGRDGAAVWKAWSWKWELMLVGIRTREAKGRTSEVNVAKEIEDRKWFHFGTRLG
jgi:hypothetical protein